MDAGVVCTDWMRPTPPPVLATHSHQSQGVVLDRRPSFPLKNSGPALIEREPLENLTGHWSIAFFFTSHADILRTTKDNILY